VELQRIEPATEIALTCRNSESEDSKGRESTCGYAKGVDGVNTHAASVAAALNRHRPSDARRDQSVYFSPLVVGHRMRRHDLSRAGEEPAIAIWLGLSECEVSIS
jgi:hypothetical protein